MLSLIGETFLSSVQCPFWLASQASLIKDSGDVVRFELPGEASIGADSARFSVAFSLVAAFCFPGILVWRCNL